MPRPRLSDLPPYCRYRDGTNFIHFRYQFPKDIGWKNRERSLDTTSLIDARRKAILLAAICIREVEEERAKRDVTAEERPVTTLEYRYEPGTTLKRDGFEIEAHADHCLIRYSDRHERRTNNHVRRIVPDLTWTHAEYLAADEAGEVFPDAHFLYDCPGWRGEDAEFDDPAWIPGSDRPQVLPVPEIAPLPAIIRETPKSAPLKAFSTADEALIEKWIAFKPQSDEIAREARQVWHLFRTLTGGKAIKDCDETDAVKLREHLLHVVKNRSKTVQKKIGHLSAILNHAGGRYRLENPFARVMTSEAVWRKADATEGIPFTEGEMAMIYADLVNWTHHERLLWVLCATTGMRAGEAFLIEAEKTEAGIRCFQIKLNQTGDRIKNRRSVRDLPVPVDAAPYLPKKIEERLLNVTGKWGRKNLIRDVNRNIAALGITEKGKSLKSTRTRAIQRLQNVETAAHGFCPEKVERQITGHAVGTDTHDKHYAKLHPMQRLKPFVDHIGLGRPTKAPTDCAS